MKTQPHVVKKLVNYRLSESARGKIFAVASDLRLSHAEVLERLIERYLGDLAMDEANRIAEIAAKYQVKGKSKPPAGSDASGR
jgi:hypothetical protein